MKNVYTTIIETNKNHGRIKDRVQYQNQKIMAVSKIMGV